MDGRVLKRNLVANFLGQGWAGLMGLVFIPLYIKYLGIEAYGLIGLFTVLTVWLGLLDIGMPSALGRQIALFSGGHYSEKSIRDLLRSIEILALLMSLSITAAIALSADWLARSWLKPEGLSLNVISQAFTIMGLVASLRLVESIYRSALFGLQKQVIFNIINSSMATLRGLGAVGILAWISPTIEAFFMWQAMISIITLAILARYTYTNLPNSGRRGEFSLDSIREIRRFAVGVLGITFLATLLTQIDKILLAKLLVLTEFGYYTLAGTIAGILYMIIGPITQAYYPRFCALHGHNNVPALAESYHRGAQLVTITAGSAAIVLALYSETFLQLWTQNPELAARAAPLLSLLVLGNFLNGLNWIPYQAQLAHGITNLGVYVNIIAVLFIVPAIILAVPEYGAIGAAWTWVTLNTGYLLIAVQFMYHRILTREKWTWFTSDILYPLMPALAIAMLVKFAYPSPESLFMQITTLGGLATIVFLVALRFSSLLWPTAKQWAWN